MRIVFTGGGTGGHFYPIIAVAEAIHDVTREERLLEPDLYYLSTEPYDETALFENSITFKKITSGKIRRYFSLENITDFFKIIWGCFGAFFLVFRLYPDVVFSKGGYVTFPVVFAARILGIPVVIHESDTVPGMVNAWSAKFALRIAISYPDTIKHLPHSVREHTALTGVPIRKALQKVSESGAREYLHLEPNVPVVFILGGSQGAEIINETVLDALPALVERYEVIHQVGQDHLKEMQSIADVTLEGNPRNHRYKPFGFIDALGMRMAAGAADVVVTRAGSTLFEIAAWKVPAIVIPITKSARDHQHENAFAYARSGAGVVVEEENLSDDILVAQIDKITGSKEIIERMKKSAEHFARLDAGYKIARQLILIGIEHESE